jgi:hypothetical protein
VTDFPAQLFRNTLEANFERAMRRVYGDDFRRVMKSDTIADAHDLFMSGVDTMQEWRGYIDDAIDAPRPNP